MQSNKSKHSGSKQGISEGKDLEFSLGSFTWSIHTKVVVYRSDFHNFALPQRSLLKFRLLRLEYGGSLNQNSGIAYTGG